MTASGHFADTHGLTGHEPNLTSIQCVVAWADTQNSYGMQLGCGPMSPIPRWGSTRHFTEDANAHKCRNQQVYWLEQGSHALNFQQADFESAAQEYWVFRWLGRFPTHDWDFLDLDFGPKKTFLAACRLMSREV